MTLSRILFSSCLALLLVAACNDDADDEDDTNPDDHEGSQEAEPKTFNDQVELGMMVYVDHCAECHGDMGQGTDKAPRVVGLEDGALPLDPPASRKVRKEKFVTVGDVANFAVKNMPADDPGSLSTEEYLAVLAFDLKANGINLDKPLTLDIANTLTIPR
ncbi:MAG TPA: cytochrome c [Polyangiales bacterium]|nr:cytochrome c [Polyangiales bacterium]